MRAVAIAESGRPVGKGQARIAWPWTVTAGGSGRYFATKAAAIAHVRALRRDGVRSIDVGCMQINLRYHPRAFESLDEAFDPERNAAYAGDFLARLYDKSRALAFYHSGDRVKGSRYRRRVEKLWSSERERLFEQARQSRILAFRTRRAARLTRSR
jgi:soluble lytic murein transglycosylase-like protein